MSFDELSDEELRTLIRQAQADPSDDSDEELEDDEEDSNDDFDEDLEDEDEDNDEFDDDEDEEEQLDRNRMLSNMGNKIEPYGATFIEYIRPISLFFWSRNGIWSRMPVINMNKFRSGYLG